MAGFRATFFVETPNDFKHLAHESACQRYNAKVRIALLRDFKPVRMIDAVIVSTHDSVINHARKELRVKIAAKITLGEGGELTILASRTGMGAPGRQEERSFTLAEQAAGEVIQWFNFLLFGETINVQREAPVPPSSEPSLPPIARHEAPPIHMDALPSSADAMEEVPRASSRKRGSKKD